MEKIYKKSRAKINLTLNVLNKREDNYHNLETVFQIISLYDEIVVEKNNFNDIKIISNIDDLNNETNIIHKAYMKLKEKYNQITGVTVILTKNIPMQSGLAGGSSNCATFLLCMNKLFDLKMDMKCLTNIAKTLGADVTACLYISAVKGESIGEIITKINTNMKYYILIIKPDASYSTKDMYNKLDSKNEIVQKFNTNIMISALENNNIDLLSENLYNVFEEAICNNELINKLKNVLLENGALGSLMSGSGSAVFGVFKNKEKAKTAYYNLKNKYQTFFCMSYNK